MGTAALEETAVRRGYHPPNKFPQEGLKPSARYEYTPKRCPRSPRGVLGSRPQPSRSSLATHLNDQMFPCQARRAFSEDAALPEFRSIRSSSGHATSPSGAGTYGPRWSRRACARLSAETPPGPSGARVCATRGPSPSTPKPGRWPLSPKRSTRPRSKGTLGTTATTAPSPRKWISGTGRPSIPAGASGGSKSPSASSSSK